jgi:hypothetical protein
MRELAEILALVVADARADGADETLYAEIVLKTIGFDRETLLEARRTLAALDYVDVAALLKRLARTAPRRITWHERMRAKAQGYAAMRRSVGDDVFRADHQPAPVWNAASVTFAPRSTAR